MNGVWICELERFGYTLRVSGRTKEEAETAMHEEYIRTYANWNKMDEESMRAAIEHPVLDENGEVDEWDGDNMFAEDYRISVADCVTHFYEYGKVEWE